MIVCLLFLDDLSLILQGLLLIATKAMSLFMLMAMSIWYTFRGNNLKFIASTLFKKFQLIFGGFEFPLPTVKKKYDILIVGDFHIPVEVT